MAGRAIMFIIKRLCYPHTMYELHGFHDTDVYLIITGTVWFLDLVFLLLQIILCDGDRQTIIEAHTFSA